MNECIWTGRTQIIDKYVLGDSRGETMSGCEQDWVSLGDSLEGTLQMPYLSHAIFILLSSCKVRSLYKGNNVRKQEVDWKTGRKSMDQ